MKKEKDKLGKEESTWLINYRGFSEEGGDKADRNRDKQDKLQWPSYLSSMVQEELGEDLEYFHKEFVE